MYVWHPLSSYNTTFYLQSRLEVCTLLNFSVSFLLHFSLASHLPFANVFINKQSTKFIPHTLIKTFSQWNILRGFTDNPNTHITITPHLYRKCTRNDKEKQKHLFTLSWLIEASSCVCVYLCRIDSSTGFNRIESNQEKIWISKVLLDLLWMITADSCVLCKYTLDYMCVFVYVRRRQRRCLIKWDERWYVKLKAKWKVHIIIQRILSKYLSFYLIDCN